MWNKILSVIKAHWQSVAIFCLALFVVLCLCANCEQRKTLSDIRNGIKSNTELLGAISKSDSDIKESLARQSGLITDCIGEVGSVNGIVKQLADGERQRQKTFDDTIGNLKSIDDIIEKVKARGPTN